MTKDGEFRLPLQVGSSSLAGFARASATIIPGLLLLAWPAVPLLFTSWDVALGVLGGLSSIYFVTAPVALGMLAYAGKHILLALRERPSDIVLGASGLRVEGGPLRGVSYAWGALQSVEVVGSHAKLELPWADDDRDKVNFWRLVITRRDGQKTELASAEDARELQSLDAIRDSIDASLRRAAGATKPRAAATGGKPQAHGPLPCTGCGAEIVPAETETVTCPYCGTVTRMPDEVRARLRATREHAESQQRSEQLVQKLVRQPGARRTGSIILLVGTLSLLAWPAALALAVLFYTLAYLRLVNGAFLVVAPLGFIAALYFLVRGQLSDRQGLRLLTLGFAARAPTTGGGAHHCRKCNAALVAAPGTMVTRCAYCGAENVLGLEAPGDLRAETAQNQVEAASLDETLARRRSERWLYRFAAAGALVVLVAGVVFVTTTAHPAHPLATTGHASELTRITYDPFSEVQPKVSPDGESLLFVVDGSLQLEPATGAFRGTQMTSTKTDATRPVWFPDGRGYLYVSPPSKHQSYTYIDSVRSLQPMADGHILYSDHAMDTPSLSPDGKYFVVGELEPEETSASLYVGSVDKKELATKLTAGSTPAWSPDGTHVAYSLLVGGHRQIMVTTLEKKRQGVRDRDTSKGWAPFQKSPTADTVQLTSDACEHKDPVYSPDGAYIAYVGDCGASSRGRTNVWDLYVRASDLGTAAQPREGEQLTDGQADVQTPDWRGDFVYFSANVAGNYDVWRLRLTGPFAGHGGKPSAATEVAGASTSSMRAGEEWVGTYTCGERPTHAVLRVTRVSDGVVDGVVQFTVAHGKRTSGEYRVHGKIDGSGDVDLDPSAWVKQPAGYIAVGMRGVVKGGSYSGSMKSSTCTTFALASK